MEALAEKVKVKLLAVVQSLDTESGAWHEEGQLGGVTPENFEKAAKKFLGMYRRSHPGRPKSESRALRRIVSTADEPMEW